MRKKYFFFCVFLFTIVVCNVNGKTPNDDPGWRYDENTYTLKITNPECVISLYRGKRGKLQDHKVKDAPWEKYKDVIEHIVIGDGVPIYPYLFKEYKYLSSVELPSTTRTIYNYAFYDCIRLRKITLPQKLTTIGSFAFSGCKELYGIQFPESLTWIGDYAFYDCKRIKEVRLSQYVEYIGEKSFYGSGTKILLIQKGSDVNIHKAAFEKCVQLSHVEISVNTLEERSFADCNRLSKVIILDGNEIRPYVFVGCFQLDTLILPPNLEKLGKSIDWEYKGDYPNLYESDCKREDVFSKTRSNPVVVVIQPGTKEKFKRMITPRCSRVYVCQMHDLEIMQFVEQDYIHTEDWHASDIAYSNEQLTTTHSSASTADSIVKKNHPTKSPSIDVDLDIPISHIHSPQTYAFIIANEAYPNQNVPFALNDGRIFKEYCIKTLGLEDSHVSLIENASLGTIIKTLKSIQKCAIANSEKIKIIFYYAGHAFPDEQSKTAYLLPVDGDFTEQSTGYAISKLYKDLSDVNAEQIICFIDACYSGTTREDGFLLEGTRGAAIDIKDEIPQGNVVVFSAATGIETANQYKNKQHGMFTYFLLKKIKQTKGDISLGELYDYVNSNVKKTAFEITKKQQTPTILPSANFYSTWRNLKL